MTAPSLDFGPKFEAAQTNARIRRALADIIDSIGLGVAAGALDVEKPDLRKAIDGEAGRYVRAEWILPLLRLASSDDRLRVLSLLCGACGYEPVMRTERSVERRLADLEERVRGELGRAGERVVDEERSRP